MSFPREFFYSYITLLNQASPSFLIHVLTYPIASVPLSYGKQPLSDKSNSHSLKKKKKIELWVESADSQNPITRKLQ